jgi:hypothetical protein
VVKPQASLRLKDNTPVTLAEAKRLAKLALTSVEQVKRQARKAR